MKRSEYGWCALSLASLGVLVSCGENRSAMEGGKAGGPTDAPAFDLADASARGSAGGADAYPASCAEASASRSYIGCDYWPTVTFNRVRSAFDFVAAVANGSSQDASVHVTGPDAFALDVTVPAGDVRKVYLPWVPELKGGDISPCTSAENMSSVLVRGGAYHLVSDTPVVVYQFNALQYKAEPRPGKDLSTCETLRCEGAETECFSQSNDASILLPSTALDTDYRVISSGPPTGVAQYDPFPGSLLAVTATQDDTKVTVALGASGNVRAFGGEVSEVPKGGKADYTLNAGDVLQLAGRSSSRIGNEDYDRTDYSGTIVHATRPVQVISGAEVLNYPVSSTMAGDHVEESVLPAVALGKRYVIARPTGPGGGAVAHVVRFVGNVDGTVLTYKPSKPVGCPDTLEAGRVVHCGLPVGGADLAGVVDIDFEVASNHELLVGTFLLGASIVDSSSEVLRKKGDPSFGTSISVEQWRSRYLLLAPNDYENTFLDIVAEKGSEISIDGAATSAPRAAIPGTDFEALRVPIVRGGKETHSLAGDKAFSVNVVGYGAYTSYMVPGGLNLQRIAPPPVIE